jgi:hypothetical protein
MLLGTDVSAFLDFLYHPNCLARGQVHAFLTQKWSGAFEKFLSDTIQLYELHQWRDDIELLVALSSASIVTEHSPVLQGFGSGGSGFSDLGFELFVEHDPLRWLGIVADHPVAFSAVWEELGAYCDSPQAILRYVGEFTVEDFVPDRMRAARTTVIELLATM